MSFCCPCIPGIEPDPPFDSQAIDRSGQLSNDRAQVKTEAMRQRSATPDNWEEISNLSGVSDPPVWIDLPMYFNMNAAESNLSLSDILDIVAEWPLSDVSEEAFRCTSGLDPKDFMNLSCRYCDKRILDYKGLFVHVLGSKHIQTVYSNDLSVSIDDFLFWSSRVARANAWLDPDLGIERKGAVKNFYYKDVEGNVCGPMTEQQMQNWYRQGYFVSNTLIGIGDKKLFMRLDKLKGRNGPFAPFACTGTEVETELHSVIGDRPSYMIPMLHPILLPPGAFLADDVLVEEVEKVRSLFSCLPHTSLKTVLGSVFRTTMSCELCSTSTFRSPAKFFAHLVSRQHLEKLYAKGSGITYSDIKYWISVLEVIHPAQQPFDENQGMLAKGRLSNEYGAILFNKQHDFSPTPTPLAEFTRTYANVASFPTKQRTASSATTTKQVTGSTSFAIPSKKKSTAAVVPIPRAVSLAPQPSTVMSRAPLFYPMLCGAGDHHMSHSEAVKFGERACHALSEKCKDGTFGRKVHKLSMDYFEEVKPNTSVACPVCDTKIFPGIGFFMHIFKDPHLDALCNKKGIQLSRGNFTFYLDKLEVKLVGLENCLSSLPFMKMTNSRGGLSQDDALDAVWKLRRKFTDRYGDKESNKELTAISQSFFGKDNTSICPVCVDVRTQPGRPFFDHLFSTGHVNTLYSSGGTISGQDLRVWKRCLAL